MSGNGFCVIEVKDEPAIFSLSFSLLLGGVGSSDTELRYLPRLTFILAQILNGEGSHSGHLKQPLAGCVYGKTS